MDQSPRLSLSYLAPSQAQKHVTVNDTFRRLDALVQTAVESIGTATPPGTPIEGGLYIPGAGAAGVWAGWDFSLAYFVDGAWQEITPGIGWVIYDKASGVHFYYAGAPDQWIQLARRGSFTPTINFVTNGDFSPTYILQEGRYAVAGDVCQYWLALGFGTNAYSTASGGVEFGGFPFDCETDSALAFEPCAAPFLHNVTFSAGDLYAVGFMKSDTDILNLYAVRNAAPVAQMTTANFPPSTTPIYLRVAGSYRIKR